MKKFISFLLIFSLLSITGCSILQKGGLQGKGERPYGNLYDDVQDWATYWCGPCEQLSMETIPHEPYDIELYTMKDKEYGFQYQVEAMYEDYSTSTSPYPSYTSGSFDYEYLKVYLEKTDFSDLIDRYGLTIEQEEIRTTNDGRSYDPFYSPQIDFHTDRILSDDEFNEILGYIYSSLQDFDRSREHFTHSDYCKTVYFYVWCAPTEEDKALGKVRRSEHGIFGYRTEHR